LPITIATNTNANASASINAKATTNAKATSARAKIQGYFDEKQLRAAAIVAEEVAAEA
jgi:hypothetical protein